MRLSHLSLNGYYGFRDLELSFPEHGPTVLIGKNGAGKSTILDAVAMFLAHFANLAMGPARRRRSGVSVRLALAPNEVHRGARSARVLGIFAVGDRRFAARATRDSATGMVRDEPLGAPPLDDLVCDELVPRLAEQRHAELPVLAYYRPNRGVGVAAGGRKPKPPAYPQLDAYVNAFGPQVGPFHEMLRWFRSMEDQENEERLRSSNEYRNPWLQAVRHAIERFMSELTPDTFHHLRIERHPGESREAMLSPWAVNDDAIFLIDKGALSLPLDSLSDGERGALLLVADLAMRMVITHPGAAKPLDGMGIVLIDELDLHLHPGWQRRILPGLSSVFPNLQIIATTHSPQVLSTLHAESVIILEDFKPVRVTPHIYGRDTNSLLRVMGVPERPADISAMIRRASILVDEERMEEAKEALEELTSILGAEDDMVVRLKTLVSFFDDRS